METLLTPSPNPHEQPNSGRQNDADLELQTQRSLFPGRVLGFIARIESKKSAAVLSREAIACSGIADSPRPRRYASNSSNRWRQSWSLHTALQQCRKPHGLAALLTSRCQEYLMPEYILCRYVKCRLIVIPGNIYSTAALEPMQVNFWQGTTAGDGIYK